MAPGPRRSATFAPAPQLRTRNRRGIAPPAFNTNPLSGTLPTATDQTPVAVANPLSSPAATVEVLLVFGFTFNSGEDRIGSFVQHVFFSINYIITLLVSTEKEALK